MRNVGQTLVGLARLTRHAWEPSLGTCVTPIVGQWRSGSRSEPPGVAVATRRRPSG